jgi:hypothetical protein
MDNAELSQLARESISGPDLLQVDSWKPVSDLTPSAGMSANARIGFSKRSVHQNATLLQLMKFTKVGGDGQMSGIFNSALSGSNPGLVIEIYVIGWGTGSSIIWNEVTAVTQ